MQVTLDPLAVQSAEQATSKWFQCQVLADGTDLAGELLIAPILVRMGPG